MEDKYAEIEDIIFYGIVSIGIIAIIVKILLFV